MGEEDGVAVGAPGLQGADGEVLLGDGVGRAGALDLLGRGARSGVIGIDLLAQHRALEGAAGFALLFQGQAGGKHRVRQQQGSGFGVGQAGLAEVLALVGGVRAGRRSSRRRDRGRGRRRCGTRSWCAPAARATRRRCCLPAGIAAGVSARELLGVPLLDHAEAAELALLAVEVAVVVGVAGDEAVAADVVVGLDALDHVHRERQPRDPGLAVALVLQVELGRGGVVDAGFGAEVVDRS